MKAQAHCKPESGAKRLWHVLLVIGYLMCTNLAMAMQGPAMSLAHGMTDQAVTPTMGYIVDATGTKTINDIRTSENTRRFAYLQEPIVRPANEREATWFVMHFDAPAGAGHWVVSQHSTQINDIQYFGPFDINGRDLAPTVVTGKDWPYSSRPLSNEAFSTHFKTESAGRYTLYVRVQAKTMQTYDFRMWDLAEFHNAGLSQRLFDGLCYGVIVGMLIYNLTIMVVLRDRTYGLYVLSGLLGLLSLMSFKGHLAHHFLAEVPDLAVRFNSALPAFWNTAALAFANSFMELRKFSPSASKLIVGTAFLGLANAAIGLLGYETASQLVLEYLSIWSISLVSFCAAREWHNGFGPARIYLLGQLAFFAAVVLVVLNNWGFTSPRIVVNNALMCGVAVEVVLWAMALSSRISIIRDIHRDLQDKAHGLTIASQTDAATGLANSAGLLAQIKDLLAKRGKYSLILLSLQDLQALEKREGREAADTCIMEVAARLREAHRAGDTVAYRGNGEFFVLLREHLNQTTLQRIAAELLDVVGQPIPYGKRSLTVTGFVAVSPYAQRITDLTELQRETDNAIRRLVEVGGKTRIYVPSTI